MLDFAQHIDWQDCLNAKFTQQHGQYVYLLVQQNQRYVAKFLTEVADEQTQQIFTQEFAYYQKLQHTTCCPQFKQYAASDFTHPTLQIASPVLVLPQYLSLANMLTSLNSLKSKVMLFKAICQTVQSLHDLGYVHGDLKSQHIVSDQDHVYLLDYALVQPITEPSQMFDNITATPAYMAAELFKGEGISIQSDIYALGIIFYEILMQAKPFSASTYQQWAIQHCQTEIPLLDRSCAQYQNILDKMLAKYKGNRYSQLENVISALNLIKIL